MNTRNQISIRNPGTLNPQTQVCKTPAEFRSAIRGKHVGNLLAVAVFEAAGEIHVVSNDKAVKLIEKIGTLKIDGEKVNMIECVEFDAKSGGISVRATELEGQYLTQAAVNALRNELLLADQKDPSSNIRSIMLTTDGKPTQSYIGTDVGNLVNIDRIGVKHVSMPPSNPPCWMGAKGSQLVTLALTAFQSGNSDSWKTRATFDSTVTCVPIVRHPKGLNRALFSTERGYDAVDLTTIGGGKASLLASEAFPTKQKGEVVGDIDGETTLIRAQNNGSSGYIGVSTSRTATPPERLKTIAKATQTAFSS